ncbi:MULTISPECIES: hypothetical protein [unclassified Streptomyces]|uniref:Uncharacterized protein n=1 Tax=Streptomyces thermocoprophilus TaxID=78356 RepID=A0ABV5VFI3_9ACTN|nr:hypothetical protein [Streptomyces sp. XM83C]
MSIRMRSTVIPQEAQNACARLQKEHPVHGGGRRTEQIRDP